MRMRSRLERQAVNVKVAIVLGSIPSSSDALDGI